MKPPPKYRTKAGHRPRARLHAGSSPAGRRRRRVILVRAMAAGLAAVLLLGVAADVYAQRLLQGLPSVQGLDAAAFGGDTLVTDRNGKLLADLGDQGNHRVTVPLRDVSRKMVQATIAIEDRNFYQNPGFDPTAIARAALADLRSGGIVGGGSTITQQLAKQLFLTPDQTLERKLKELVLAYQLSQAYSKDQILELYLNKNNYGAQAYGVEAAAQTYFHKHASQLDLAESAMLAGLPQAPSRWNPILQPDAARVRQGEVLEAMVRNGFITPQDAERAQAEKLDLYGPVNSFLAPHFVDYVREELERLGFHPGQQQIVVKTTLDYGRQQLAESVVRDNLAANRWRDKGGVLSSALVAMDPRTGQIVAMVGSPDYNAQGGQYNFTDRPVNPGSSIKPFTYAAAINARKATMDTPIADFPSPLRIAQGVGQPDYAVYDYDRRTHGVRPLREALANSLNIPAVKVELAVGVPGVVQFMRTLGVRPRAGCAQGTCDPDAPLGSYGAAVTLGGYPVTMLEEATGLSTIADLGTRHDPEAILSVTDNKGKVLYSANPVATSHPALDPGVAFIMGAIMSDDANRALIFGRGSPLHLPDRTAAAKTGTTEDFRDALTIGFTPDLATVVWVGDILDSKHTMVAGSDGVFVAAPAWHAFMEGALKGVPDRWYQPPPDVVKGSGNSWYLLDTTSIAHLPNDDPSPTPSPTPVDYAIPADPGTGPHPVGAVALPSPSPAH